MEENTTIDKSNKRTRLKGPGVNIWGSIKLVFFLILYETLFTFLGLGMNSIFKYAMGVSMEENLLASIFQVFAYFFFIKRIVVKREYEIKIKGRWDIIDIGFLVTLLIGYIFVYDNTLGNLVSQTFQEQDVVDTLNNLVNSKVIGFVALLMIAPIFEEIICRGVILEQLKKRYNAPIAIFVSSLIFGLIHLNFNQGVNAFFIGVIFGIAYVKTNSLIPSILLHFMNNGIYYALSFIDGFDMSLYPEIYISVGVLLVLLGLTGFFIRNRKPREVVKSEGLTNLSDMSNTGVKIDTAGITDIPNAEVLPGMTDFTSVESAESMADSLVVEKLPAPKESIWKARAYKVLNVRVFGAELFSYSVFWKLVFATVMMSLVSNLLNGFVKYGNNAVGYILFVLIVMLVLSFDWLMEKLSANKASIHYFVFILTIIVGASIASFGAKGLLMQLWSPMFEGIGLTFFGAAGVIMTGIKAEKEFKIKLAE